MNQYGPHNTAESKQYFEALYPADKTAGQKFIDLDVDLNAEEETHDDGLWDNYKPPKPRPKATAKQKAKNFRAEPRKVLADAHRGTLNLWARDKEWACDLLTKSLPQELAISLFTEYVKKWESYMLAKQTNQQSKSRSNQANIWLRKRINMVKRAVAAFPVTLDKLKYDSNRKMTAQVWANKCTEAVVDAANHKQTFVKAVEAAELLAKQWGFKVNTPVQYFQQQDDETDLDFALRIEKTEADFRLKRLVNDEWWEKKIEAAYGRFCEHCQILNGRVRKGVSNYLSEVGIREFRARKKASDEALKRLVARNEITGEEMNLFEAVNRSIANRAIRRAELMVRLRGFESIAKENGLVGGFFTITAPSKYHAYMVKKNHKKATENDKYEGAAPPETQKYLSKTWAKARAKLKRLDVDFMGFRVCEPHHDGTPHWHALFFFKPEHEQVIRYVLAEYFTLTDRHELNTTAQDMADWSSIIFGETATGKTLLLNVSHADEKEVIAPIAAKIAARFDYKQIDPSKGSATGYIAKYIAKNIDGYKMEDDLEEEGTTADKAAEAVCGWASRWGIRQFQQIGGPSVSVWRELRRLEQTQDEQIAKEAKKKARAAAIEKGEVYIETRKALLLAELREKYDDTEIARISASSSDWGLFMLANGGLFCARADFPIRILYKDAGNNYGENVKKVKGITAFAQELETRQEGWVIAKAGEQGAVGVLKDGSLSLGALSITVREVKNSPIGQAVIDSFNDLGVDLDGSLINPVLNGATILIDKQRKARLIQGALGYQLKVEEIAAPAGAAIDWEW